MMTPSAAMATILALLSAEPTEGRSMHYDVRAEGIDAVEAARMLDQLYDQMRLAFNQAPPGRVPVYVFANRAGFEQAMAAEQIRPAAGVSGHFSVGSGKIYLHVQPSQYYTRQLILHEAAHQFHAACTPSKRLPEAFWYREGIAEYYGMHNWDGQRLATGVVPAISIEDYPQQALDWIDRQQGDLQTLVASAEECPRPVAWAWAHFLLNVHARKFSVLRELLDRNQAPLPAWRKVFGSNPRAMAKDFRTWVVNHQQPWQNVWNAWQERGPSLEGSNLDGVALAVLKQTPRRLRIELQGLQGSLRAGLVFGYRSPQDLYTAQIMDDGQFAIRRNGQVLAGPTRVPVGTASSNVQMELTHANGQVTVKLGDQQFPPLEAAGQVGLLTQGCRVRFHVQVEAGQSAERPGQPQKAKRP